MKASLIAGGLVLVSLVGCASTTSRGMSELNSGMTTDEVRSVLGPPDRRSFRADDEAWQYHDVVGFGQCEYLTAWFTDDALLGLTNRRGDSVAGCGLGSQEVDWGQIPRPSLDVNVSVNDE